MKRGRKTRVSSRTRKRGEQLGESEEEHQNTNSARSITELPRFLSIDILLRLSANILLVCRCVCKTWRDLISDPEFAKLHFAKGEVYPLIRSLSPIHVNRTLYLVEPPVYVYRSKFKSNCMDCICHINWLSCEVHSKKKLDTKLKIPLRNPDLALDAEREANEKIQSKSGSKRKRCTKLRAKDHRYNVANSCNGLLCLSEPIKNDPVAVCNPITGEYINLPVPTEDKNEYEKSVDCALGFNPQTNQYKVIRMFSLADQDRQLVQDPITRKDIYNCRVAEIHTLGTSSWRRVGYAPSTYDKLGFPTYLNGALHWLCPPHDIELDDIISFDFVNEKFHPIPPPRKWDISHFITYKDISLGELRGCLCISYFDDGEVDVWVMEDYGVQSSWKKKYRVSGTADEGRYLWGLYQPITVLNNGGLLLFHRRGSALLSYNAAGSGFKYLKLCGVKSKYEAIPYVPSFVSLKDVLAGGEESEVMNINSRCAGLKLLGETKTLYLEEADADWDSDLNPSSYTYSDGDDDCESS